jgi:hypothetical protein
VAKGEISLIVKNVYEQVKIFYSANESLERIIKKDWVEGFLRQQAWSGKDDEKLRDIWQLLQLFIVYLAHSEIYDLDEMTIQDYSLTVQWLSVHIPDFEVSVEMVSSFFLVLIDFYQYLYSKKILDNVEEIQQAAMTIIGEDSIQLPEPPNLLKEVKLNEASERQITYLLDEKNDLSKLVSDAIESLMFKLGKYFQQEEFRQDFDRALYLYTGPFDSIPEDQEDDFWLGFWDYFLFDYHLSASDQTPLQYFYSQSSSELRDDELHILKDLLSSKFAIFYIQKITNQETVECVDLFSGEKFELPYPDLDYKTIKRLLFFGHVFSQGLLMINYVTSIEVSVNLRRRIKEEVLRQKEIFAIQCPEATLDVFFRRHSLAVRHMINILITLAKVNVTSFEQLDRSFPIIENKRIPDPKVSSLLQTMALANGFSLYDSVLMGNMWNDYCRLTKVQVRKPKVWAAAVMFAFSQLNCIQSAKIEELAEREEIAVSSIYKNRNKISEVLQLQKFDARYLSEEGFVISLFMP